MDLSLPADGRGRTAVYKVFSSFLVNAVHTRAKGSHLKLAALTVKINPSDLIIYGSRPNPSIVMGAAQACSSCASYWRRATVGRLAAVRCRGTGMDVHRHSPAESDSQAVRMAS